jgi:aminoglycoside 6-adenylyltransferase
MDNGAFEENGMKMSIEIDILLSILSWAQSEENVRAVVLTGSRAGKEPAHELSDYDVILFSNDPNVYLQEDTWLSAFGNPWIIVREKAKAFGKTFHTRLVIFEGGTKVDWTLMPIPMMEQWLHKNTSPFQVLLDKDNRSSEQLSLPMNTKPLKPTQKEFHTLIEEFWFEAYHVAVYLKRKDLWSAQFRCGLIRDHFILKMIEWKSMADTHWAKTPPHNGKDMSSWVSEQIWKEVAAIFPHCDQKECWDSLLKTMALFRRLGNEIADQLKFSYPLKLDTDITDFVMNLFESR